MAQVLMGYDVSGNIRKFDSDGTLDDSTGSMDHCFFLNFTRLLVKDEIKKNSLRIALHTSGTVTFAGTARGNKTTFGDYLSANEFRTSPAGDYGLMVTSSTADNKSSVGLVFYQAGVVVLTSSIFLQEFGTPDDLTHVLDNTDEPPAGMTINAAQTGSTIDTLADSFRYTMDDIDFNNTIELNSAIYFCRINHNEYNYSSNPTYVTGSKLRVKNNVNDLPVTYITSVGLYSPDNELLAVAKLSEPIRKDPNTELTLRVRLDY